MGIRAEVAKKTKTRMTCEFSVERKYDNIYKTNQRVSQAA